jgi:uncharacterized protein (DUF1697 family)
MKYVLLLRGINVGKSIKISMKDLKIWLNEVGFQEVETYLNSGNVILETDKENPELTQVVNNVIKLKTGKPVPVLVKSSTEIITIAQSIPAEWQNDETQQTYVAYLFDEVADEKLIDELPIKKQYVSIYYSHKALVWNIKRENYNKSQITKLVNHSSYGFMTTRNVNTARKLAEICIKND